MERARFGRVSESVAGVRSGEVASKEWIEIYLQAQSTTEL